MYIVETSPLKLIKGFRSLSYFSSTQFKKGDIVKVPFRNSEILSLVTDVKKVASVKADIKNENFMPRKIRKQKPLRIVSDAFLQACFKSADEFLKPAGLLLAQAVPSKALKQADKIKLRDAQKQQVSELEKIHKLLLNDFTQARHDNFKALVRQQLALGQSVLLVTPNLKVAQKLFDFLSVGISSKVLLLDSNKSANKFIEQVNAINTSNEAKCIIGTSHILFTQPYKLGLIIIEQENAIAYKRQKEPKLNMRKFAQNLSEILDIDIVFADSFLSLENYEALFAEEASALSHIPKKIRKKTSIKIIDLKKEIEYSKEYKLQYPVLSREVLGEINMQVQNKGKVFIYSAKSGIASQVVCNDCASVLKCPKCLANLKLHKDPKSNENHFFCSRCGYSKYSNITCPHCGSWRLKDLGVGIEKVEAFLKQKMPNLNLIKIDSQSSDKETAQKVDGFYNTPDTILLGTSKALFYLQPDSIDYSVAVSLDALLSLPNFNIEEQIFARLIDILDKSMRRFDVQVKNADERVFKSFENKELQKFVKSELALRKKLNWPPFVRLIKVTVEGSRKSVIENMQIFIDNFKEYKPRVFKDFEYLNKDRVSLSAILRVPSELWPYKLPELKEQLEKLPNNFLLEVDPEQIF